MHVLVPKPCDQAGIELNNFLDNKVKKHLIELFEFEVENKRLGHFYLRNSNHKVQAGVIHSKIDFNYEPRSSSHGAWFQYQ